MKHLIQQILKEEFNPDDLTSPDINMSPATELEVAKSKYGWRTYIPQIKKRITFNVNPESWNLSAGVVERDIESKGHGSFGDDPHIDYEPYNLLDHSADEYYKPYYQPQTEKLGHTSPDKGNYELYDIKDALNSIKTYSEEAEKVTVEFKKNIERLFADYKQKINVIANNSDFTDGERRVKLVDVDKEGNLKSEDDFRKTGDGWFDQPRHLKNDLDKKRRKF
jgi:hypothetical protein